MFLKAIKILFPPKCIFCGSILPASSDMYICSECFSKIPFMDKKTIMPSVPLPRKRGVDYTVCACRYSGIIRDAMKRFKYYDRPGYYRAFAMLLVKGLKEVTDFNKFDIITCVPLHKHKEHVRGYNQSLLIAKQLGKELGLQVDANLLSRERSTESQSLLRRSERHYNVAGAFKVRDNNAVKGKSVLLVDDVMTTGSTLDECGKTLKEAGAVMVVGAVIASGKRG